MGVDKDPFPLTMKSEFIKLLPFVLGASTVKATQVAQSCVRVFVNKGILNVPNLKLHTEFH